ncbi:MULTISPECIES: hypothetical protein [unclassified Bradyrhizobium]|uniref:DUF7683 domain-containing protein n=1 Tax=unclassified Bradyrhizobium TaxID=2631580 RepID=UPI002915DD81|nr:MULTISPECIES: hypothetical protein [unclassified Bradyrhizobium]
MNSAQHRLVGYDRQTELEAFELPIPERIFQEVGALVHLDDDDPEGIGCYELTDQQARQIATMIRRQPLPTGLDFFIEAHTA